MILQDRTWSYPCPGESLSWIWWDKYFLRYWVEILLHKWPLLSWKFGEGYPVRTWSSPCPGASVNPRLCTKSGQATSYIFFRYWVETILNGHGDLENKIKSHSSSWSLPCNAASVYKILWRYLKYFLRYWAETILHMLPPKNDLCDLENKGKVMRFKLGFCLALGPLCTKFGDSS